MAKYLSLYHYYRPGTRDPLYPEWSELEDPHSSWFLTPTDELPRGFRTVDFYWTRLNEEEIKIFRGIYGQRLSNEQK